MPPSMHTQFPPLTDKAQFPLLAAGGDLPCTHLLNCEELTFFAVKDPTSVPSVVRQPGRQWYQYGDARWPSLSSYIEVDTRAAGIPGHSGILVVTYEIPEIETDPLDWVARHGPAAFLFSEERAPSQIEKRLAALREQYAQMQRVPEPGDASPHYAQCHCIYRSAAAIELVGIYLDLLSCDGIPISRFRMASVEPHNIPICRLSLHALFCLNERRLQGLTVLAIPQLTKFEPLLLDDPSKESSWVRFHPLRVLRARSALRAIANPSDLREGIMRYDTAQHIIERRRLEANLQMIAFDLHARRQFSIADDINSSVIAFAHRANGGAIYVLPQPLVDEFAHTDCADVQMQDIQLPFPNLYLHFTPPQPLFLAEGAAVDGCYVLKQGDAYSLILTSRRIGVDYERTLSIASLDPTFSIELANLRHPQNQGGNDVTLSVEEAVERGLQEFLDRNAPPTDDLSQTITRPDGTAARFRDVRAESRRHRIDLFRSQEPIFRASLNILINALCFISFRPEDIAEEWSDDPPQWMREALIDTRDTRSARDRKQHALRVLANGEYIRIRICGKNLFNPVDDSKHGSGSSPRAHWRRGHWRRQRHGKELSCVTIRWIRPTIVKKDSGFPAEARLYEVERPEST